MLRRATHVLDRARARIRAAREYDPYAFPERRVVLVMDDERHGHLEPDDGQYDDDENVATFGRTTAFSPSPPGADPPVEQVPHAGTPEPGEQAPPLGSPAPDAPDAGGTSGPPQGGVRPRRPAGQRDRSRGSLLAPDRPEQVQTQVPNGLRLAAAWSWRVLLVGAALYALLVVAAMMAVVVVPVIVALLLAALLQPGAAFLVRRGWPHSLAATAMLIVGVGAVAGIVTLVIERFTAGYTDLADQVGEGITRVQDFVTDNFPVSQAQIDAALETVQRSVVDNRDTLTAGALTTAATLGEVLTGFVLALFTLFFFLKDGRSIWLWFVGLAPRNSRAYLDEAARRAWRTLVSYVRATALVALVDAVLIGIALFVIGVQLPLPLAALVFLGAFIPIIGSFLAGTVAVLVALVTVGPIKALVVLGVIVAIMQLEGHVLQPLLLGRAVRVHPLAVVLAIAAGLLVGGVFGALISVPLVACLNVAGTYLARRTEGPRPPEPLVGRAAPVVGVTDGHPG
ncbi:AI-2E family transporter [Modestobacter sp. I12A-02628]|uniref:AI-2E family transporter n=1 Tax=Goekera deserti TaxID=2497753 RepID=A0A7K3W977_9ACTN|nr:AI-2E family transporter [Goekera deserti]MPQ98724.1 AI-2E family transporter [Goekera deserti]NDI49287.1 AI-2E family transporter [Goekera deserti]NEL53025.1 AI-2E family transporter [Goekera deserti]